ncbi:MAG TPA: UDP-N-acetyl glucosamine 2-epimerase [candidate division Zixibacteria bacterium]
MTVFGTRPQFIKLAVLWRAFEDSFRSVLVDSGQHYDFRMAGAFLSETGLRRPDHHLGIGSAPAASQVGRIADALDPLLARTKPDAVVVFGDTSTTAGGAIAAAYRNIPLAHIEAGMRSGEMFAAEEKNRIIADHLSQWRFAPTSTAVANLQSEGIGRGVYGVGDVMYEQWRASVGHVAVASTLEDLGLVAGHFYYLTCHRAETVDDAERLRRVIDIVAELDRPVLWPLHPRAVKSLRRLGLRAPLRRLRHLILAEPMEHRESLALVSSARAVLTDSGGIQREAYWSGTPCLLLREQTEWRELSDCRAVVPVGLHTARVQRVLSRPLRSPRSDDRLFRRRRPGAAIIRRLHQDLMRD